MRELNDKQLSVLSQVPRRRLGLNRALSARPVTRQPLTQCTASTRTMGFF